MQIVEFSASVDAFWRVIMFIRWSGTLLKWNPSWHWLYIIFLNVLYSFLALFEPALPSYSVPLVPELQSSLKALRIFSGRRRKTSNIQRVRYTMAMTTVKSATMLLPIEDAFKQHVLRAKFHTWFGARATFLTKSWSNQLVIAGQIAMMDSSLQQCTLRHLLWLMFET